MDPVVAIAQTPPLAWLQQVPVVGALIVTPIVAFINQIPVISDVLHPLIGYPVQPGLPVGAPLPRDVKVISFDGTQIYTHFMPALGLAPGQTAPTILNGPALPLPGATNLNGALLDDVVTDAVGQVSIGTLRAAGYNVVTWDPRGEWSSGGVAELDLGTSRPATCRRSSAGSPRSPRSSSTTRQLATAHRHGRRIVRRRYPIGDRRRRPPGRRDRADDRLAFPQQRAVQGWSVQEQMAAPCSPPPSRSPSPA